ncbi:unnamed protein product [Candidula unifasciata]|uniref:G-protein coupled receptors family 1 profile domain-containing protein n=1 Tax=Candidula unifasciata TaxID=100452 RepID=A0A8S3YBZ2_9EUPU|nr:unnamed protein product [Candidula unifasciata]
MNTVAPQINIVNYTRVLIVPQMDLISDEMFFMIMFINMGIICQTISLLGTIANIINITIFIKQGLSDATNICLLALAVSDLCSLITIMWTNVCYTPSFKDSNVFLISYEVQLITGIWPHIIFTRTTGWITAFICLQRCVCVILPLKVRNIFTTRRHILFMVTIYVITLGLSAFAYFSLGIGWKFDLARNQTLVGLIYYMDPARRKIVDQISYGINGVFIPITAFLLVVICTVILVIKLNQQAAWRTASSSVNHQTKDSSSNESNMSARDKRVSKMIILISSMFITCFIPAVCAFIGGCIEPELTYDGGYKNLFLATLSVSFITEAINSSSNIFIYFSVSTKYRNTFRDIFKLNKSV